MNKLINVYTTKGLENHDSEIYMKGLEEGNKKTTKIWQEEFINQSEEYKKMKNDMVNQLKGEIIALSKINEKKLVKVEKEEKINCQIEKILDIINRYE